jgi:hypothetical protein
MIIKDEILNKKKLDNLIIDKNIEFINETISNIIDYKIYNLDYNVVKNIYSNIEIFNLFYNNNIGKKILLNKNPYFDNLIINSKYKKEILNILMNDKYFFNKIDFYVLNESVKNDFEYFKTIINSPKYRNKINLSSKDGLLLRNAVLSENLSSVKFLLDLNVFDLSIMNQWVFEEAATFENDIFDLLLNKKEINPSINKNKALKKTIVFNKKDNFLKLIKNKKVIRKINSNFIEDFLKEFPERNIEIYSYYFQIIKKIIKLKNF